MNGLECTVFLLAILALSCPPSSGQELAGVLWDLLSSRGANVVDDGALSGSALLQPLPYTLPDAQPVDVSGELLVAGSGWPAGSPPASAQTRGTVLDLSAYEEAPAFRLLPGSSLHLRDLTLLLPAPSPEALAAEPASVLAHLITAAAGSVAMTADGGEDASPPAVSLLLSDVTLMLPGDAELRTFTRRLCEPTSWRHRGAADLRVLGGVVMYGNDTMQLAPPAPPAVLLRTNVTSRSASAAPWACSATAVSGAGELRATAAELLAVTSGTVLLSLTGNVTIDPETGGWGPSGLVVPEGSQLGLYGDPTPGRATQLDFGGLESALSVRPGGVVVLADLVLLGLPYPRDVQRPTTLLAAWVHSVAGFASGSEANGSFVFLYEEVVRGLGPRGPEYGVPCTLKAPPVSQTRRRTFWDMRGLRQGLRDAVSLPPTSPWALTLDGLVLYNLPPTGIEPPAPPPGPQGPAQPPELPAYDPPAPPLPAPPSPAPPLDLALSGMALPLWAFTFDRATAISFRRLSFHGWEGRDVTVTSDFPPDAPTFQLPFDTAGLGPGLEAACPQPPPPPPSPPMLAASLSPPALPSCRWRTPSQRAAGPHTQLVRAVERSQAALQADTAGEGAVRLLRIIGRGSYGVVHLGAWRGLAVAAKVLVVHDTLLGAEGRARQRAVLEAAVGASLDHPNVVATYAYDLRPLGEQPGDNDGRNESWSDPRIGGSSSTPDVYQLHILQEFCSGGSLKEALGSRGALGGGVLAGGIHAALALRLAFDVAAGLRHVHAAGIVHGDVSAGNVLLARRSAPEDSSDAERGGVDTAEAGWRSRLTAAGPPPLPVVAKVADFGLSVRLAGSATHASGCYQGTPTYIAPEVHGRGRVSRASDVYSFGVLLLELMHGMPVAALWEATVPTTSLASASTAGHAAGASPLLALLRESLRGSGGPGRCPARLRALLEACLATDPAGRPTMEQVGAAKA
ncbi:hypothetical protein GPECTOR_1g432 [Gonium pectorale]|uniref:Protein kinase domain-containing protein n=1 Tax=Gonium pectorale TaxID=33097 RepID=A0A150H395_GONPE|nr:hypothetical protein GPECTOR_1g432 [Gonium pectorale]|eukprot:KXZ56483.1 hypothetical protein GPECTOR_1g432 [Gonium pectorale]